MKTSTEVPRRHSFPGGALSELDAPAGVTEDWYPESLEHHRLERC